MSQVQNNLALSFRDLQIRVAEYLGIVDYTDAGPTPPSNASDLELVKRLVNDGWRKFCSEKPDWHFFRQTISLRLMDPAVTINGENWRYRMPWFFQGTIYTRWTYGTDGPRLTCDVVDEGLIREKRAASSDTTGYPTISAFRKTSDGLWEALFWPTPAYAENLEIQVRAYPQAMVRDTDRHFAGVEHDNAVHYACLAKAEERETDGQSMFYEGKYQDALAKSKKLDESRAARSLGVMVSGDNSDFRDESWRVRGGVSSYNGTPITF